MEFVFFDSIFEGERVGGQGLLPAHHDRALNNVLELADIAGPRMVQQRLFGFRREHQGTAGVG